MQNRRDFLIETAGVVAGLSLGGNVPLSRKEDEPFRVQILQCDVPNKNNRIYPRHVVESAVEKYKSSEMLGMLGMQSESYVKFSEVSHQMYDLEIQDVNGVATLFGKVRFLGTPRGKVAKSLVDDGLKVAFRTAGIGNGEVNEDGNLVISDSYKLVSINMIPAEDAS